MYKALFVTLHHSTPYNKNCKKEWHTEPLQDPRFKFLSFQLIILSVLCVVHKFRKQSSVSFTLSFDIRNELVPIQCNNAISTFKAKVPNDISIFVLVYSALWEEQNCKNERLRPAQPTFRERGWVLESSMSVFFRLFCTTSQLLVKIPHHAAVR